MTDEQKAQQQGQQEAEEGRFTVTFSDAPPEAQQQAAQQQAEATPEGDANPADAEQKGDATPAQKSAAGEKNEPSAHEAGGETQKPRLQKRIDRLTKEKYDLRRENEDLKAKLSEGSTNKEPDLSEFDSYDDYQQAVMEHQKRQSGNQSAAQASDELAAKKLSVEVEEAIASIRDSFDDGKRKYADFEKVISAPDFVQSDDMLRAIATCENPEDVSYYLATHKEENARIIGLQGEEQALEIKSIQKKLVAPPQKQTKKTTAAPPPINPVGDSGDIPRTLNTVASQAEYEALREAQDRAAAKEGWL
jgi:hypothetical protein